MPLKSRGREKVTFSIPSYLLELADMQAELLGLDRYDVIRMAIGQGLMVLRVQTQLQSDPSRYAGELLAVTNGEANVFPSLSDKVGEDMIESIKRQKEERDKAK